MDQIAFPPDGAAGTEHLQLPLDALNASLLEKGIDSWPLVQVVYLYQEESQLSSPRNRG